jgi:hypothetical protein
MQHRKTFQLKYVVHLNTVSLHFTICGLILVSTLEYMKQVKQAIHNNTFIIHINYFIVE